MLNRNNYSRHSFGYFFIGWCSVRLGFGILLNASACPIDVRIFSNQMWLRPRPPMTNLSEKSINRWDAMLSVPMPACSMRQRPDNGDVFSQIWSYLTSRQKISQFQFPTMPTAFSRPIFYIRMTHCRHKHIWSAQSQMTKTDFQRNENENGQKKISQIRYFFSMNSLLSCLDV